MMEWDRGIQKKADITTSTYSLGSSQYGVGGHAHNALAMNGPGLIDYRDDRSRLTM